MAFKDLHSFIKALEKNNELIRIKTPVDSNLEITEITDRVSKAHGPALLFENVKNSKYPVLINSMGSYKRMAMAIGVDSLYDIGNSILDLLDVGQYSTFMGQTKTTPQLSSLSYIFPKKVKTAPCQETIEDADLDSLPILKCWPQDGGPFITLPIVITKDPENNQQNIGMYRLQKYDKTSTGMHWHLHKHGRKIYNKYRKLGLKKMPVAVAIGSDPTLIYSASAPLPKTIDEMLFAGFLRKSPIEIVKCITSDIYVPANAEFILEGYVDLDETKLEGPFGDHTGYYSLCDHYPVFHVEKITRKKNPIYPTTIVGKPPMEDCYMGKATERIFLPLLKKAIPEIIDMNMPLEGIFHNCAIVSIKKSFPKHAFKVMHALWGINQMMYTKMLIVVDDNIDAQDISTVMWKVFNNVDAKRDILISQGPLDAQDHSSNTAFYGNRMGIDATKKLKSEGYNREWPDDIEMTKNIKEIVDFRWNDYGINI